MNIWPDKIGAWLLNRFDLVIGFVLLCIVAVSLGWFIWFMYTAHRDCAALGFTDVRLSSLEHEGIWCGKYIGEIHITMRLENLEDGW